MLTELVANIDTEEAAKLHRKYKEHRAYSKPIDHEIERLAGLVAKGKKVILGVGSVQMAGLNASGLPNLAIGRADTPWVMLRPDYSRTGGQMLSGLEWADGRTARTKLFDFPVNSWPTLRAARQGQQWRAMAPHIPPDVRPRRGIENYTLIWEATWEPVAPVDPILGRKIGKTDFYLVVAQWDLSPIERMVMNARLADTMRRQR